MKLRAQMGRAIRHFFHDQDFLEVETPLRIPAPAPEPHIDAVSSGDWFLHTSPELCMKRLLAANYPKIYQICKCFRAGERGARHLPEFTILEWYRAGADYRALMEDCEELITHVAWELGRRSGLPWQGRMISLRRPWERLSVGEAFARYTALTVADALKADRFDEAMASDIEPCLGIDRPVFLYDYPAELGALARVSANDPGIAERFELYIGGLETGQCVLRADRCQRAAEAFRGCQQCPASAWRNRLPHAGLFSCRPFPDAPFCRDCPRSG